MKDKKDCLYFLVIFWQMAFYNKLYISGIAEQCTAVCKDADSDIIQYEVYVLSADTILARMK